MSIVAIIFGVLKGDKNGGPCLGSPVSVGFEDAQFSLPELLGFEVFGVGPF